MGARLWASPCPIAVLFLAALCRAFVTKRMGGTEGEMRGGGGDAER